MYFFALLLKKKVFRIVQTESESDDSTQNVFLCGDF